jgi:aspartyl-tRNA(Asn)/glutamyl-tRNA(Gln) amidotransferase subunit A
VTPDARWAGDSIAALWDIRADAATIARVEAAVRGLLERGMPAIEAIAAEPGAAVDAHDTVDASNAIASDALDAAALAAPSQIAALAQRLAVRATTVSALLDERLARIEREPRVAACFVALDRAGARAAAAALDATPRAAWAPSGIAGVPIAHKDLFAAHGRVATFCADPALHHGATTTATALARLAAAGAVDLGGLHMAEFAMGAAGYSETYGFIDNPAAAERVSGGSSSGSAAAVAHGVVRAALGTDTGGSIRIPAAFCGVVGFKPTNGLVPADGVQPVSTTLDCVGPVAADVAGVARVLDVLTSPTPIPAPGRYERALANGARGLRIGVLTTASLPGPPDADVATAWARAATLLRDAGVPVVDVGVPDLSALNALAGIVFLSEAAAEHAAQLRRDAQRFGPQVRERLLQGLLLPAAAYVGAMRVRSALRARWQREVFAACDVLLLPVSPMAAPLRSSYAGKDNGEVLALNARVGSYTPAFNYLGVPVLAVPCGDTIGMQLVAAPHRDADVLRAGAMLEQVLRGL